jgi:hypothetical protein
MIGEEPSTGALRPEILLDMHEQVDGDYGSQQHHPGFQQPMPFDIHVRAAIFRN